MYKYHFFYKIPNFSNSIIKAVVEINNGSLSREKVELNYKNIEEQTHRVLANSISFTYPRQVTNLNNFIV